MRYWSKLIYFLVFVGKILLWYFVVVLFLSWLFWSGSFSALLVMYKIIFKNLDVNISVFYDGARQEQLKANVGNSLFMVFLITCILCLFPVIFLQIMQKVCKVVCKVPVCKFFARNRSFLSTNIFCEKWNLCSTEKWFRAKQMILTCCLRT